MKELRPKHIIFFDGVCHLCNGFVDAMIRLDGRHGDTKRKFQYAPLQGESAKSKLSSQDLKSLETVIVMKKNGEILYRSNAVLFCLGELDGIWALSVLFRIFPQFIRDGVYAWVAKNRYGWFGQRDICRLPQPQERQYLLP
jgi:predicted DCC family thiol-disulfide oxidoreductase YuxK